MNAIAGVGGATVSTAFFWAVARNAAALLRLEVRGSVRLPLAAAAVTGLLPIAPPALVALSGTFVAASIDARTGYIPDSLTIAIAVSALTLATARGDAETAFLGALLNAGLLVTLFLVTRGRGLGLGDVKLGTAIGIGFGPLAGAVALGAAFVAGGVYASFLLTAGRARRGDAIRFGPFLALGAFAAVLVSVR
jgi:leader peptidase (prepilin peptidase)/N-methyltransferase